MLNVVASMPDHSITAINKFPISIIILITTFIIIIMVIVLILIMV